MNKIKKITVKFFLNEAVKPVKEGNVLTYPLYMLLTYNRRSTMLRSHYGKYYKDLKSIEKTSYPGLLAFEERIITKTILHELSLQGEKFDIKGIGEKYDKYCLGIDYLFEKYMKSRLYGLIQRLEPFEFSIALNPNNDKVSFDTLFNMASKLYEDFDNIASKSLQHELESYLVFMRLYQSSFYQYTFPTIIEWMDQSAIEDYRSKLKLIYKKNDNKINESIELINRIMNSSLKE